MPRQAGSCRSCRTLGFTRSSQSSPYMEQLIELLKQAALVIGVVAPGVKLLFGWAMAPKNLEDRYSRVERFFHCGGPELSPLLMESAFGSALGHLRLTAIEIPLVLKQREPTRFMERYLQVQQYIGPNADGTAFVLRSAAASHIWCNVVRLLSLGLYVAFAAAAGWLGLFGAPSLLAAAKWLPAIGATLLSVLFAVAAWLSIVEGRRITWAIGLHASQVQPNPSIERTATGGLRPPVSAAHVER